jgi:hypothetical protein
MPWSLDRRTEGWCVIKESDGSVAGCHDTRVDAIKQQRALYARESMMASVYEKLDSEPDLEPEIVASVAEPRPSELVKIEIGKDSEALTASMMAQMERMSERQSATDAALVAALQAIGSREPVVNVHTPDITVEPTPVTIHSTPQITVEQPPLLPAQITVQPADVTVTMPERSKTITFERDPLTHEVIQADVVET